MENRELYLDLIKKSLTNWIYGESEYQYVNTDSFVYKAVIAFLAKKGMRVIVKKTFDKSKRENGLDWPITAHTMIGIKRLNNLQQCIEDVIEKNIAGDLIETGVWRGGSTIFMRAVLKAYGDTNRKVWVADSFEGLPKPNEAKYPKDSGDIHYSFDALKVTINEVKANFSLYGLLDGQVCFLKGWFKDTLPNAPFEKIAIARLDGDMYESTIDAIKNLYDKISIGGYLIVDDYCIPSCKAAIHDYRNANGIDEEIIDIDGTGAYWKKVK